MAFKIRKHRHNWTHYPGSQKGIAIAFRKCECGKRETLLRDIETARSKWVDGNFFENVFAPVFVIAYSREKWTKIIAELYSKMPETSFVWTRDTRAIDEMKKYSHPRFVLGEDWIECNIIHHPDMRVLLTTGHW